MVWVIWFLFLLMSCHLGYSKFMLVRYGESHMESHRALEVVKRRGM